MTDKTDMPEGITRDDMVHGETYFTAADMATASAQGFRDGVASASVNADGSITPGTWAHLKLMMEESAWGGEIQLSDALANVDEFARASIAANAGSEPVKRVFLVATGEEHEGEATYTRYDDAPPPLCDSECLCTHPSTPEGMVMVPLKATNSITCAIENEVDSQLVASAMDPRLMHRQDGSDVWDAAIAAVSAPPTSSADSRKGE